MRLLAAWLLWLIAAPASAQLIVAAEYADPTTRYPHGVLGDAIEWGALKITVRIEKGTQVGSVSFGGDITYDLTLNDESVFEDLEPRLVDVDGDDKPEIVAVESHQNHGARLVVFGLNQVAHPTRVAWTNYIGQRNRWLAPVGVADFDGDGVKDIAFIDRPHLARTLRVFPFVEGKLKENYWLEPLTNHRIGDDFIVGGVRTCAGPPQMVLLNAQWTEVVVVGWQDDGYRGLESAPYTGLDSVENVMKCEAP